MLRLEPGDEICVALAADLAEADVGMHLVLVAMNRSRHGRDLRDIGVGRDVDEIVIVLQAPEQAIEDRKALGIPMQDRGPGEIDEFRRDIESAVIDLEDRRRC